MFRVRPTPSAPSGRARSPASIAPGPNASTATEMRPRSGRGSGGAWPKRSGSPGGPAVARRDAGNADDASDRKRKARLRCHPRPGLQRGRRERPSGCYLRWRKCRCMKRRSARCMRRIGCQRTLVTLSWAPVTAAAGAGLRGAAEAGVVKAAALNAASRAAVIIDVRKGYVLSCRRRKRSKSRGLRRQQIVLSPAWKSRRRTTVPNARSRNGQASPRAERTPRASVAGGVSASVSAA